MKINYEEIAIQYLEKEGCDVEKVKLFGLPWYLKAYLYPIIWIMKDEVEEAVKNLLKLEENENE